jgi:hypothetical protein
MYKNIQKEIKILMYIFSIVLLISGITAFPIEYGLTSIHTILPEDTVLGAWLTYVANAYISVNNKYPFLAYGTDWLAFAHILFAILFWGAATNPVKNKWVIQFGMISCIAIIPLALIAGYIRHIPFYWQCVDMSFGIIGIIPLLMIHRRITLLEKPF